MMGDPALWLEKQDALELASRDTVLLGTDGLWDNLFLSEIVELIRVGELFASAQKLAETVIQRMDHPVRGLPSKPDDVSFILYQPSANNEVDDTTED
jgi:serine/threonine protein phosphatase PrpC